MSGDKMIRATQMEGWHMMRGLDKRIERYANAYKNASQDATLAADNVADAMREYYDEHRPRRWWQRKQSYPTGIADDLMLGLMRVAIDEARNQGIIQ